jgi:ATP-binding cassette subfamily B protein
VGVTPVALLLSRAFRAQIAKRNREYRTEMESMSAHLSEVIEMIPVTRAHGVENEEIRRTGYHIERVKTRGMRLDILTQFFGASNWVSLQVFSTTCLVFTAYLAYEKRIPIGDVVMYQSFFGMILTSVSQLLNAIPQYGRGVEAIRSIGEILECPDIEQNEGKAPVARVDGRILFEGVEYTYPKTASPAVRNVDLDIQQGEVVAFVGESGAGKTTMMSLVIGFHRPTRGRILLDGRDMAELDLRTFRRFIAVVPQTTILFSGTVRDNITYGIAEPVDEKKLLEVVVKANAMEFVEKLPKGLDTPLGEHGARLSGGQRQRIAIARALIRDPRIIILDEATSSLDVRSEALVQQAVERLIAGRTTLIVAHRLSTIRTAHRVVVMKNGEIVEIGDAGELVARRGEFYALKQLQS